MSKSNFSADNLLFFSDPKTSPYKDDTFAMAMRRAFANTFSATGCEHNLTHNKGRGYYYNDFVKNGGFADNPVVSFFGVTGLGGAAQALYVPKVILTTLHNIVRLLTEMPLYLAEAASRHLFVQSKLKWQENSNLGWRILSAIGMFFGAVGYCLFKPARLAVRLVTAPLESAKAAWDIHPVLGVASGVLSTAAYVCLAVFASPAVATLAAAKGAILVKVAATAVLNGIKSIGLGAMAGIGAGAAVFGMLAKAALEAIYKFVNQSKVETSSSSATTTSDEDNDIELDEQNPFDESSEEEEESSFDLTYH